MGGFLLITLEEILKIYPIFTKLDTVSLKEIFENVTVYKASANKLCFSQNECKGFTIVLEGLMRVQYISDNGRELTVYRVGKGGYCHITLARLLYKKEINFEVYSEKSMKLAIIPEEIFMKYFANNPIFLREIYRDLHDKMDSLSQVINNIGFESVESRLIAYFEGNKKLSGSNIFKMTHEQIGVDIGATREAVSRTLAKMQEIGLVKLSRKRIEWLER